jgi:phytoene/squalene synthetase
MPIAASLTTSPTDRPTLLPQRGALDAWERQLDAPTDPIAVAFATVRSCHGVPVAAGREQLAGVRMDLTPCQFATWEELRPYAIGWPGRLA